MYDSDFLNHYYTARVSQNLEPGIGDCVLLPKPAADVWAKVEKKKLLALDIYVSVHAMFAIRNNHWAIALDSQTCLVGYLQVIDLASDIENLGFYYILPFLKNGMVIEASYPQRKCVSRMGEIDHLVRYSSSNCYRKTYS